MAINCIRIGAWLDDELWSGVSTRSKNVVKSTYCHNCKSKCIQYVFDRRIDYIYFCNKI